MPIQESKQIKSRLLEKISSSTKKNHPRGEHNGGRNIRHPANGRLAFVDCPYELPRLGFRKARESREDGHVRFAKPDHIDRLLITQTVVIIRVIRVATPETVVVILIVSLIAAVIAVLVALTITTPLKFPITGSKAIIEVRVGVIVADDLGSDARDSEDQDRHRSCCFGLRVASIGSRRINGKDWAEARKRREV